MEGVFNIVQGWRATDRHVCDHLATSGSGQVSAWWGDDRSGRQRWILEPLGGNVHRIRISGGTNAGETYLSCTDGNLVDLFDRDDGSGRQRWTLEPAQDGYRVRPGGVTGAKYLTRIADGPTVQLTRNVDNLWYFVPPESISAIRARDLPPIVGVNNKDNRRNFFQVVWNGGESYISQVEANSIGGINFAPHSRPGPTTSCWMRVRTWSDGAGGNVTHDSADNFIAQRDYIAPIGYDFWKEQSVYEKLVFSRTL